MWCVAPVAHVEFVRPPSPPVEESPLAAASLLRAVCGGALGDRDGLARLAVAVERGMLPIERCVQAIVETRAPHSSQEDAIVSLWPPLRALRPMP